METSFLNIISKVALKQIWRHFFVFCLKLHRLITVSLTTDQGWVELVFFDRNFSKCIKGFLCTENHKMSVVLLRPASFWPSAVDSCSGCTTAQTPAMGRYRKATNGDHTDRELLTFPFYLCSHSKSLLKTSINLHCHICKMGLKVIFFTGKAVMKLTGKCSSQSLLFILRIASKP